MEFGADDYITKSFDGTELLNAIETRLKKAKRLKQDLPKGLDGLDTLVEVSSTQDLLSELKENRSVNKYKKKQMIYSEGNHPSKLFYILKGKVKVYRKNEDGKELIVDLYNEGDFVGYIPLLEDKIYTDSAEALEESELALIPKAEFQQLVNSNPVVMKKFIGILSKNVHDKENRLLGIAYDSLRKKVAETLVTLYQKYNPDAKDIFYIDLSRENLAAIAGVAKESLIRTLTDFKDEGLISLQNSHIYVLNYAKLENMYS